MGPKLGRHTQDEVEPCFRINVTGCQDLNVLRYSIPKSFLALEQAVSMCGDHDKSEVSNKPRYLKHSTCSIAILSQMSRVLIDISCQIELCLLHKECHNYILISKCRWLGPCAS